MLPILARGRDILPLHHAEKAPFRYSTTRRTPCAQAIFGHDQRTLSCPVSFRRCGVRFQQRRQTFQSDAPLPRSDLPEFLFEIPSGFALMVGASSYR
jgi:hypothetical protein